MEFDRSSIISVNQFDRTDIERLFALAHRLREVARGHVLCKLLEGKILGNLFFEASTRSRMSFATAFMRLGGQVNSTTGVQFSSMAKGETLADTIGVIQSFCDCIVIRHADLGSAELAARRSRVPVINAGDGPGEHPTQALLDLFTIFEERQTIDGSTVAMVGDLKYGRTVHSLAKMLTLYQGVTIVCIAPEEVQMPEPLVAELRAKNCTVIQTRHLDDGIRHADVVYVTRIQEERFEPAQFAQIRDVYVLDRAKVTTKCKPGVTIMHPLPRTTEIATDVDDLPNAAYFRQAENGVMVRMALFLLLFGLEKKLV